MYQHSTLSAKVLTQTLIAKLGYTQEQIDLIGEDVFLMQGTGNPHVAAAIGEGETVVDLGSGFGVDCMLAAAAVGPHGRVLGIDMSEQEVHAAMRRVAERGVFNVDFRVGDMEQLPLHASTVDVVLSNGGFCLVPDKRRAFAEIFRVLRPGGRFSISCTVRTKPLETDIKWPSCMLVFMDLAEVDDILSSNGFTSIAVDSSNKSMDVWEEVKAEAKAKMAAAEPADQGEDKAKLGIHRGDPAYAHLKSLKMNERFARVTVSAIKPQ